MAVAVRWWFVTERFEISWCFSNPLGSYVNQSSCDLVGNLVSRDTSWDSCVLKKMIMMRCCSLYFAYLGPTQLYLNRIIESPCQSTESVHLTAQVASPTIKLSRLIKKFSRKWFESSQDSNEKHSLLNRLMIQLCDVRVLEIDWTWFVLKWPLQS